MTRLLLAVLVVFSLTGCERASELWMSSTEKVTLAFPLPDELKLAADRLLADGDAPSGGRNAQLVAGWQRQLELRALNCAPVVPVRWWHSVAAVRQQPYDSACILKQDAALIDWVGVRRVGQALQQPALVPLASLGARRPLTDVTALSELHAASAANVAVVQDTRSRFSSVNLTTGKLLHAISIPDAASTGAQLSPNGRLFALPVANRRGMQVFDVATGNLLWKTDRYNGVLAWLSTVDAAVVGQGDGRGGLALLDLQNGREYAYYDASRRMTWAVPAADAADQLWLVGSNSVTQVTHRRTSTGELDSNGLATWPLRRQATSLRPLLMQSGRRMLYVTNRDLAWIDLQSGDQGAYEFSLMNGRGYSKLDEDRLLVDTGGMNSTTQVLDVVAQTLAPVESNEGTDGLLLPMSTRTGFMRRGFDLSYVSDQVGPTGPALPAQRAIADAQLQQQLARLDARTAAEAAARAAVEAADKAATASGAPLTMRIPSGAPPSPMPLLSRVPAQAQVAIVGVYEGSNHRVPGGAPVRIFVPPSSIPLVLVLSSYESVQWLVQNSGRPISAVLLSGYSPSTVLGAGDAPVLRIGSAYAYQLNGANYAQLKQDVARYVPNRVDSFQGLYQGKEFSIPNR
ncbi:hypothetical protein RD110_23705 [Rhodoferax koreense]|uniref:Pyrrolo-quinoline quinone repeat domain-containing protein n=1 Tax=Rhodoferax koreensis TaxID=1842727 RepID=A0A1P8K1G4_9BURK|nr:PQQ-binding-like beta-propeller repeat protein [Rhodoferax koreense]APW39835.1 hypothetical protein RD110_23705 [Rhodoferax koreense]